MVPSASGCLRAASLLLFGWCGALTAQVQVKVARPAGHGGELRPILQLATAADGRAMLQKTHGAASAAIDQGLKWLVAHQDKDGRWNADEFMDHDGKENRTDGVGRATYDVAVTGLAVLALAREGTAAKPLHPSILRGVHWLALQQQAEGKEVGLIGTNEAQDFVYGHAIATLGLWAAAAATGSAEARTAAESGLVYLDYHRNPYGVWRYRPRDNDADSSVTTWAALCYFAANEQGFKINQQAVKTAAVWFDAVTDPKTGQAGYTKAGEPSSRRAGSKDRFPPEHSEAMTAAALLCRMGLGHTTESSPMVAKAAQRLADKPPTWEPKDGKVDHVYWFFASEALRHLGGDAHKDWATALEAALVKGQRVDGAFAGSWDPVDPWGEDGGRLYATALSVLALQGLAPFAAPAAKPAAEQAK